MESLALHSLSTASAASFSLSSRISLHRRSKPITKSSRPFVFPSSLTPTLRSPIKPLSLAAPSKRSNPATASRNGNDPPTLPFASAFSAFTNEVIWLIVISFFFARGFVKTGLGDRIATYFVKCLGKSTLGLSYGLTLTGPESSSKKLGSYLIQSQFQAAGNSSALFLTAAAQNLLCLKLAEELGIIVSSPWVSWFKAASVPALVSLLLTPLILYKLYPPETKDTPDAPAMAAKKLENMGPVTRNEWVMVGTMLLAVTLWVCGETLGIPSVVAAMIGLSILLLLGVLDWNDCLSEKSPGIHWLGLLFW
ncbi:hypothetical protein GQ457_04G003630 [Hibiscus cannabinus]